MTPGRVTLYGRRGLCSGGSESVYLGKTDCGIPLSGRGSATSLFYVPVPLPYSRSEVPHQVAISQLCSRSHRQIIKCNATSSGCGRVDSVRALCPAYVF